MKKILNNKVFKIVYGIVKFLVIALIVVYVGFLLIQKFSNSSSVAGYRIFRVASSSMSPKYEINDVLLIKEASLSELKVGDDITYQGTSGEMNGKIVTHRIISINGNTIQTKGIANDESDPSIDVSQVYGKVCFELVPVSYVNSVLSSKIGFFFLIFLPFVAIIFLELLDTINNKNEK